MIITCCYTHPHTHTGVVVVVVVVAPVAITHTHGYTVQRKLSCVILLPSPSFSLFYGVETPEGGWHLQGVAEGCSTTSWP